MTTPIEVNYSVSEGQQFMRCRLMWDITAQSRQALVRVGPPKVALQVGSFVHFGIAALIQGSKDPIRDMLEEAGRKRVETEKRYKEVVGSGWSPSEVAAYDEIVTKAMDILENYLDKWGMDPIPGWRYLPKSVECTFKVPVHSWSTAQGLVQVNLCGTFDAIALDERGKAWIVDHKTYSQRPSNKDFAASWQFLCYQWAACQLFGWDRVGGFIYDGISTKVPEEPEQLKNGLLSRNKAQKTTPAKYRRAIARLGHKESMYADFLEYLDKQYAGDQTEWHYRQIIPFNRRAVETHGEWMKNTLYDMVNDPLIYPNFRWEGCWDCGVQDLCHARLNGEDWEYIAKKNYVREEASYGTLRALKANEVTFITGLEDLF